MYIIHDRLTPHIQEYTHALRIKNTILRYWPTKVINGVKVMGKLFIYNNGVIENKTTEKLLPLLNISVEDLKKENWDGIENYYIYWQRLNLDYVLTAEEIKTYIEIYSVLDETTGVSPWESAVVTYNPMRPISAYASDTEIINHLTTATSDSITFTTEQYNSVTEENDSINRLLGIALLDSSDLLFEKEYVITGKEIGSRNSLQSTNKDYYGSTTNVTSRVILKANIEVRYRRKTVIDLLDVDIAGFIDVVKKRLEATDDPIKMWNTLNYDTLVSIKQKINVASKENSINASLVNMYNDTVPVTEDDVNYNYLGKTYIKKSGLEAMKAKDFVPFFGKSLKTGYTEEEAEWWEKIIAIVIAIVVVVVSVFTGLGAAGLGSLGALMGAASSTVFVFMGAFALALSIGTFLVQGLAMIAGERGLHGFATYLGKVVNFLGVVSTIAGIVSVYVAFKTALAKQVAKEAAATSLKEAGKEVTAEALEAALKDVIIKDVALSEVGLKTIAETAKTMLWGSAKMSMMDILNKTISAVNWAANYFMEKDLAALQGDLTAQQEKADELKQEYEQYKGSVDKVYYYTSDIYDSYYNPYFNDFELSTGEGPDRIWATKAHWRCQNSIDWLFPK